MSIQKINRIVSCAKAINDAPLNEFYFIFHEGKNILVCYKFIGILDINETSINVRPEPIEFPLCEVYYFESLGILSAYVIHINGYYVDLFDAYIKIRRPSAMKNKFFSGVRLLHQDKYINVMHSDDGACLVSTKGLKRVIKPEMVRRSEKRDNDV